MTIPTVNVAIVAHTSRINDVQKTLNAFAPNHISFDNGLMGCEENHRRVWQWHRDHPADWSITLEDDAKPVRSFRAQLTDLLHNAPAPIVSFYLGKKRPTHWQTNVATAVIDAYENGAHWITATALLHAVGVAIQSYLVPDLCRHLDTPQMRAIPIDEAITFWALERDIDIAYCQPCAVDHLDADTIAHHRDGQPRTPGRVAWTVGTRAHWDATKTVTLRNP